MELDDRLKILADPTRLAILRFLADPVQSCCRREDGICGCDLETFHGSLQPTISHHLKQPAAADLVTAERLRRWVYNEPVPARLREIGAALEDLAGQVERNGAKHEGAAA